MGIMHGPSMGSPRSAMIMRHENTISRTPTFAASASSPGKTKSEIASIQQSLNYIRSRCIANPIKREAGRVMIPDTISIHIEWSIEDDVYIARCEEFPSLATHGDTLQKAYDEIFIVLTEILKWLVEEEEKII